MSSFDRSEIFIYSPRLSVLLQLPDSTSGDGEKRGKFECGLRLLRKLLGFAPKGQVARVACLGLGFAGSCPWGRACAASPSPNCKEKQLGKNSFAVVVLLVSGYWRNASFFSFLEENHSMRRSLG